MADRHSIEQRRKNMQAVKSKDSEIELTLRKALWAKGYRYRKNVKTVFGKPDIVIRKYKLAIFADSEFWHGKDWETKKHEIKSNKDFWIKKIEGNINRDQLVNETLRNRGWKVLRFWGKDIKKSINTIVEEIEKAIGERSKA
jgi:DNA mismatch endonuclease Vsr